MSSLDSLPADQRAVLELVLRRGRTYDDIARLLSIDRAAVRQRALAALDALGPRTQTSPERRALITDYLLGQLPARVSEDTRERLASSPSERAWARVIVSELAPLASERLPEIPVEAAAAAVPAAGIEEGAGGAGGGGIKGGDGEAVAGGEGGHESRWAAARTAALAGGVRERRRERRQSSDRVSPLDRRPSSRAGGAVLLAVGVLVVIAVVIVLASTGGGGTKHNPSPASRSTTPAKTTSTPAKVIAQVNLNATAPGSQAKGVAQVIQEGNANGILLYATNVPPNTKNDAYAVWLYNSPSDSHILGFVNPGVGADGRLQTAGALPTNASSYKQLVVSRETQAHPRSPGQVILQGAFNLP